MHAENLIAEAAIKEIKRLKQELHRVYIISGAAIALLLGALIVVWL